MAIFDNFLPTQVKVEVKMTSYSQSWWSTNARKNTAPYTPVFRTVFEKNTAFLNLTYYFPDITAPKLHQLKFLVRK